MFFLSFYSKVNSHVFSWNRNLGIREFKAKESCSISDEDINAYAYCEKQVGKQLKYFDVHKIEDKTIKDKLTEVKKKYEFIISLPKAMEKISKMRVNCCKTFQKAYEDFIKTGKSKIQNSEHNVILKLNETIEEYEGIAYRVYNSIDIDSRRNKSLHIPILERIQFCTTEFLNDSIITRIKRVIAKLIVPKKFVKKQKQPTNQNQIDLYALTSEIDKFKETLDKEVETIKHLIQRLDNTPCPGTTKFSQNLNTALAVGEEKHKLTTS